MRFESVKLGALDGEEREPSRREPASASDIAVIGIGLRLPFAQTEAELLEALRSGLDAVRPLPANRKADADRYFRATGVDPAGVRYGEAAYLEEIDRFDYAFFRLSPKEAGLLDPNQRLFLETAWSAVEDAGLGGRRLAGSRTGVYVGYGSDSDYKRMIDRVEPDSASMAMPGNVRPIIASRLSYLLDLRGPSLLVDTTCSSSLVAVHMACQALRNGECDVAIAGGVQLHLLPVREFEVGIESSTARTRTFDDAADGTGTGEGAAAVVLKPLRRALADRDPIYAVVKASALNQDGGGSVGITAPNADAQADVLAEAWRLAGIRPETIGYIEAHGTGTKLGDPIELEGIRRAFGRFTDRKQFCAVGSVKSNLGHLDNAAGIAGLLKAILSLKHKQLFPTLHVDRPNRRIPFVDSPVYVNTSLRDWEAGEGPRRCGVSSFGISGTNCHAVLEEAPAPAASTAIPAPQTGSGALSELGASPASGEASGRPELLPLSARSAGALLELVRRYADELENRPGLRLAEVCYTAAVGRGHYPYRLAFPAGDRGELIRALRRAAASDPAQLRPAEEADEAASRAANEAIRRFAAEGFRGADRLRELGRLYEEGADPAWELLYRGRELGRVPLPTYPFERKRCWLRLPGEEAEAGSPSAARIPVAEEKPPFYWRAEWRPQPLSGSESRFQGDLLLVGGEELGERAAAKLRDWGAANVRTAGLEGAGASASSLPELSAIERYETAFARLLRDSASRAGPRRIALFEREAGRSEEEAVWLRVPARVLGLLRALKAEEERETELCLIVPKAHRALGEDTFADPNLAAIAALGKAVQWELPRVSVRVLDYGDAVRDLDGLTAELAAPLRDGAEYKIAFRGGARYVERILPAERGGDAPAPIAWRTDGVYVVTGGLGGVGLVLAERIAAKGRARIALLGRSAFPPREAWDAVQAEAPDSRDAGRIASIRAMERAGASVETIRADVADESSLRDALEELRRRHGRINGIVHAAGSGDGDYLVRLTEERFEAIAEAKTKGALLLDRLTREDRPDFFVLCSSAITLVGGVGSGPYAAANAWLDAFAANRRAAGLPATSVGWPAWDGIGLSAGSPPDESKELFRVLSAAAGAAAFEELLTLPFGHVWVGEPNRDGRLFELADRLPFRLEPPAGANAGQERSRPPRPEPSAAPSPLPSVKLKGKGAGEAYTEIEAKVAGAWVKVLGYEELDVGDNFFELGGDSILITRLHKHIQELFPGRTRIADLFSHPTIAKLSAYLEAAERATAEPSKLSASQASSAAAAAPGEAEGIAIVGMTLRLPDAADLDGFWANLAAGRESIGAYPEARRADSRRFVATFTDVPDDKIRFSPGGYLEAVDGFDYGFFQLSPREASLMDPNQRLFLEACWEAIEDAGYGGGRLKGTRTGVYLGYADWPVYGQYITKKHPSLVQAAGAGNTPSLIASRIAYLLDLHGPAFLVDTACSSSLVAIHLACRAILGGECDAAIAGGVKVCLMPVEGVFEMGIESSRRQTRAFDDDSDGTVWGEGTVAFLLKPLSKALADRDRIYAVIKGSAINQDGASVGITAPNATAQEDVLARAWEDAGIDPATITYIETHGTGTKLGDPIEIDGIQRAFGRYTDRKQFCAVGSVKANIGHLDSAAGAAGLAKAIAALVHKRLPPALHFERPNRNIAFESSPVYVNDRLSDWETDGATPRRCGVSSFGFSGTNAHVVLEEAPPAAPARGAEDEPDRPRLLALSGRSAEALRESARRFLRFLDESGDSLDDVCGTANAGRGHYAHRQAYVFRSRAQLRGQLEAAVGASRGEALPDGVYAGEHRVVAGERESLGPGQLTAAGRRRLSEEAARLTEALREAEAGEAAGADEGWRELARLYAAGAEIDWERLYEGKKLRQVRVPTYPFQRSRCWVEPGPAETAAIRTEATPARAQAPATAYAPAPAEAALPGPSETEPFPEVALKGRESGVYGPLELRLGRLWGRLLGLGEIDVYDDFFDIGGHSLLAIEMETELARIGIAIDADDLYRHRTIVRLARHLEESGAAARIGEAEPDAAAQRPFFSTGPGDSSPLAGEDAIRPPAAAPAVVAPAAAPLDVAAPAAAALTDSSCPIDASEESDATGTPVPAFAAPAAPAIPAMAAPVAGGPEALVLPGIEPFNDIFYRNCFFNSLFPVVRAFGRSLAPFLANDRIVYGRSPEGRFFAGYEAVRPLAELFAASGIRAEARFGSDDIVGELVEGLSEGRPAIVWVDSYYESIRTDAYRKQHIDHTLLVFGYDRRERLFHIVEHDRRENLSYKRRTLPFEEMALSFAGFLENFADEGAHGATHYYFSPAPYPDDGPPDPVRLLARHLEDGDGRWAAGIRELEAFIGEYALLASPDGRLRERSAELVATMNEAIAAKQVERYRLNLLLPEAAEEDALLEEAIRLWEFVRKGTARLLYGAELRPETIAEGRERLSRLAEAEMQLQQLLMARLEAYAERAT